MAICNNCGATLRDDEVFCGSCGAKNNHYGTNWEPLEFQGEQQYGEGKYRPQPAPKMSGIAVASLVFGIVTWFLGWITFGIPAILGIVFGVLGMSQCKREGLPERGLAVAGFALSVVYVVVFIACIAIIVQIVTITSGLFGDMSDLIYSMPSTGYFY